MVQELLMEVKTEVIFSKIITGLDVNGETKTLKCVSAAGKKVFHLRLNIQLIMGRPS